MVAAVSLLLRHWKPIEATAAPPQQSAAVAGAEAEPIRQPLLEQVGSTRLSSYAVQSRCFLSLSALDPLQPSKSVASCCAATVTMTVAFPSCPARQRRILVTPAVPIPSVARPSLAPAPYGNATIHPHVASSCLQPASHPAGLEDPEAAQPVELPELAKPLWTHPSGVLFALSPLDHFQVLQRRSQPTSCLSLPGIKPANIVMTA